MCLIDHRCDGFQLGGVRQARWGPKGNPSPARPQGNVVKVQAIWGGQHYGLDNLADFFPFLGQIRSDSLSIPGLGYLVR
jgi:hypothetical protein